MKYGLIKKARFASSVSGMYLITLLLLFYFIAPATILADQNPVEYAFAVPQELTDNSPKQAQVVITKGRPVRLVVPASSIDITVADGVYNTVDHSWSISQDKAHFATLSAPANDFGGNTFIYGHNSRDVLGKLSRLKTGDTAHVYTDNHLAFTYTLVSSKDYKPDDASVFSYYGPPILTVQTCAGAWNELRRMYQFNFTSVEVTP